MVAAKQKPVQLILAQKNDAQLIHQLKKEAFMPLYEIYRDTDSNPALDPVDKVVCQLAQEEKRNCHFYEKLGFRNTLSAEERTLHMTLIGYERYSQEREG